MSLFDTLTHYANMVLVVVIILGVCVAGVLIYFKKYGNHKKEDEKNAQYSLFRRKDSKSYVPFDEITDDMTVMDNGTRFVASINCKGFDFFTASAGEQYSTQDGYLGFINLIDHPITLRIDSRAVDLEVPIKNHENALNLLEADLFKLYNDYASYIREFDKVDDKTKEMYAKEAIRLKEKIENMEWQSQHLRHLINYQEELSGLYANPIREERYIFDWIFEPSEFPNDITKEEIYERANKELERKANQFKHALITAGVKTMRDTTSDLINLNRRHFHPYKADVFKQVDLENSSYNEMVVSSKSFEEAKNKYVDSLTNNIIEKYLEELVAIDNVEEEVSSVVAMDNVINKSANEKGKNHEENLLKETQTSNDDNFDDLVISYVGEEV